jgi:hypothetical protein
LKVLRESLHQPSILASSHPQTEDVPHLDGCPSPTSPFLIITRSSFGVMCTRCRFTFPDLQLRLPLPRMPCRYPSSSPPSSLATCFPSPHTHIILHPQHQQTNPSPPSSNTPLQERSPLAAKVVTPIPTLSSPSRSLAKLPPSVLAPHLQHKSNTSQQRVMSGVSPWTMISSLITQPILSSLHSSRRCLCDPLLGKNSSDQQGFSLVLYFSFSSPPTVCKSSLAVRRGSASASLCLTLPTTTK